MRIFAVLNSIHENGKSPKVEKLKTQFFSFHDIFSLFGGVLHQFHHLFTGKVRIYRKSNDDGLLVELNSNRTTENAAGKLWHEP